MTSLDRDIAGCAKCAATLVTYDWMPISYFGDISKANAWTISINPSAREFTDSKGSVLTGGNQRFARLADFPDCGSRRDVAHRHLRAVLDMQHTVLGRAPYRNYFNPLGRFILLLHGRESACDPLAPFTEGVQADGSARLFCHLDIVKCATKQPWSSLIGRDRRTLIASCSRYLEDQIRSSSRLDLILINGRTAYGECLPLIEDLQFSGAENRLPLGDSSTRITSGILPVGKRSVTVVAWTANVVNGHMKTQERAALARAVRAALRDGATR
jgi:hypothetical protein